MRGFEVIMFSIGTKANNSSNWISNGFEVILFNEKVKISSKNVDISAFII